MADPALPPAAVARCPHCRSERVAPASGGLFGWLVMLVGLRTYACKHCFRRFLRPFGWRLFLRFFRGT